MISRVAGALVRAFLVAFMLATPALILPGTPADTGQVVALVAIFAAILTFAEYAAAYPCLFEFRDAPPFNRVRFGVLFVIVGALSLVVRGTTDPDTFSTLLTLVGSVLGEAMSFRFGPLDLVVLMLPATAPDAQLALVTAAFGLAATVGLLSLALFFLLIRFSRWPLGEGTFNVWVNLPTFDPTGGRDVVRRLEWDGRINIALGLVLPFLMPAVVSAAAGVFGGLSLGHPQTLVWAVAAWVFLPTSLFMRGMAMRRIAAIIAEKRRSATPLNAGVVSA
ncbi:hypothetical protein DXV76_04620 [Rhodobacteraceae bacterium CCMM004]|nr:hypothetical protein DXV76_04620 [Rhodobacteraceae bacterium CCMM004]